MSFEVAPSTLESLEWRRLIESLGACCRTPQGRRSILDDAPGRLFEPSADGVRARLAETSEARRLVDEETLPPVGGARELAAILARSEKGGILEAAELVDVRRTLEALHATLRFFDRRREHTPRLSRLAMEIVESPRLEARIERCIDESGEVRDAASPLLAESRREAQRLASELQSRIERTLRHEDVQPHLSDQYYTVRNGRFGGAPDHY